MRIYSDRSAQLIEYERTIAESLEVVLPPRQGNLFGPILTRAVERSLISLIADLLHQAR